MILQKIEATQGVSPTATLIVVSLAQFTVPFLLTAINVALPAIGHDLQASAVQLSLIVTVYALSTAMFLLPAGRLGDIYGRKRIFIAGFMVLGITTLALGMAGTIQTFLAFRFAQGLGAGMIISTSMAILSAVYPPEHRGHAFGITVSMVYLGATLGPTISGFIIMYMGWRWLFFIIFAMIIAAIVLTLTRLKGEWSSARGEPFDIYGTLIFAVSLGIIVLGASSLTRSSSGPLIVAAGIIGLGIFARIEWRLQYPLLDLRLLIQNLLFTFSNLATFLNYAAVTSFMFLISLYLQYVKGYSPDQAGMLLIVQPIVQALLSPVAGRMSEIYPPANIATAGMALSTVGLIAAAAIDQESSLLYIAAVMILLGVSIGFFGASNMTAIMNSVGPRHQGTASSMVATMRTIGTLFSATSMAVILSIYLGDSPVTRDNIPGFVTSMHTGLYFFSAMGFMGTLFSIVKGHIRGSAVPQNDSVPQ